MVYLSAIAFLESFEFQLFFIFFIFILPAFFYSLHLYLLLLSSSSLASTFFIIKKKYFLHLHLLLLSSSSLCQLSFTVFIFTYSLSWISWIPAMLSLLHLHTVIFLLHSSSSLASTFFILIFFYCLYLLLASTIFNLVFFTTSRICFFIILLDCTLKYNLHLSYLTIYIILLSHSASLFISQSVALFESFNSSYISTI